jgi:hypothetical protein
VRAPAPPVRVCVALCVLRPPGPNGYPISPLTDCVAPVAPEDWLAAYTNTIEQVRRQML